MSPMPTLPPWPSSGEPPGCRTTVVSPVSVNCGGQTLKRTNGHYAERMALDSQPLQGVRVLEFVGLGPAPFAAMLLADLGAEVIGVQRPGEGEHLGGLTRGRPLLTVDAKSAESVAALLATVAVADVVIEGFRPGVMERLGLSPQACQAANPKLVYARMTGWGQEGARAHTAGHDLTYLAVTGALHLAARQGQRPAAPANLLGDFGGGSMFLVTAILASLLERERTGHGRVLDVSIVDGVAYLAAMVQGMRADGLWAEAAGESLLDGGAPFYDVYECADGRWLAVAPLEPQFFAQLLTLLNLDRGWAERQYDPAAWPELRQVIAAAVRTRSRDEWDELARDTDACLAPVLTLGEAAPGESVRPRLQWASATPSGESAAERLARWKVSEPLVAVLTRGPGESGG